MEKKELPPLVPRHIAGKIEKEDAAEKEWEDIYGTNMNLLYSLLKIQKEDRRTGF